jgi:hypothetical protein
VEELHEADEAEVERIIGKGVDSAPDRHPCIAAPLVNVRAHQKRATSGGASDESAEADMVVVRRRLMVSGALT